jgi:hypothetical protein
MKDEGGVERSYPDRIIKSIPNSFDVFPSDDFIDAAVDDGEDIIKLEEYGGRLLQFKEDTLYIINIAESMEFLESQHRFRGLDSASSSVKSSIGIVWCNVYGVYVYDGNTITELTLEKIGDWSTFYEKNMVVSFHPIEMKLYFFRQSDNRFRVYDIGTKSFTEGDGDERYGGTSTKSAALMYDKEMHVAKKEGSNIYFMKWEEDWSNHPNCNTGTDTVWHSKDFDFEVSSADTKIYKVHISYKTDNAENSNVALTLVSNDGSAINENLLVYKNALSVSNLLGTSGEWKNAELVPNTSTTCKSAKIVLANVAANVINKSFKINDMDIIYRNKAVR